MEKITRFEISLVVLLLLLPLAPAAQDETFGTVTNVVDGDTFDVMVEKYDPRLSSRVERVRLADVDAPEMSSQEGQMAKDLTTAVLLEKRVYLDIDDLSGDGRDTYGRLVCVAYLTGVYGQPVAIPCFNRMLVDSGHAQVKDFTDNEFDPEYWWSGKSGSAVVSDNETEPALNRLVDRLDEAVKDLLRQLLDYLVNEVDKSLG